ncbi:MAG: malonyl-ACP O-methyltransferase BioC [Rhodocyclaceae bacterium]
MGDASSPDKTLMRRAFERAAGSYDAAANLQRTVCARLGELLEEVPVSPRRILDAGSGTGFGATVLGPRFPVAQIIELDIAHGMLQVSRAKRGGSQAVCGDIESLPLAGAAFDLVWSSLALQWSTAPARAFGEIHRVLRPGGWLHASTLGADTLWELRAAFDGVDPHSHVNRFDGVAHLEAEIGAAGLAIHRVVRRQVTLRYASVRTVLHDLKAIGAHNVTGGRPTGLMGKARWRQVEANYESRRSEGTLPATYEVIYVLAQRPE